MERGYLDTRKSGDEFVYDDDLTAASSPPKAPPGGKGGPPIDSMGANDVEPFAAALIEGLRRTPTSGPLYTAAILSVVWVFIGFILFLSQFGERIAVSDSFVRLLREPDVLVAVFLTFLPVPFFWTIAYMIRRSKELRLMAQAMLQTSLRLAQLETFAREAVTSVGQAVRNEVAAMSDGIERALARAGELEVLVSNELTALERSYSDNEERMKKLVEAIENERRAMTSLAGNIETRITGRRPAIHPRDAHRGVHVRRRYYPSQPEMQMHRRPRPLHRSPARD